jgi:uncharacterized protein (DUF1697 family)
MLLKDEPAATAVEALRGCIAGREYFEARRCELYAYFPDGFGTTKLTTALIDRKLRTAVTARNWNSVLKIAEAIA